MKRNFFLTILTVAVLAAAPAAKPVMAAQYTKKEMQEIVEINQKRKSPFYQALTADAEKNDPEVVWKTLKGGIAMSRTDRDVAIQWLEDHTFGKQTDQSHFNAFYFQYLADLKSSDAVVANQLGKLKQADEAAVIALKALMTFEILANADAERCYWFNTAANDPADREKPILDSSLEDIVYKGLVAPRFIDISFAFHNLIDKETYDRIAIEAIEMEGNKSARPRNDALCNMGSLSRNPSAKPVPFDQAVWNKKRNDLRTFYKKAWTQRFYKLRERTRGG